mmetsp:Transcript_36305/g.116330  ORF Transcript_36305/g.116330 Transcript_36305/m.116330 type:complete len:82 (-) Transcript_36305:316-561(-)
MGSGLSDTGLVLVVVAACILAAVLYAFKDKFPLIRHLPEIGWLPCICHRPDYMQEDRGRPHQTQMTTAAEPVPEAQVIDKV